MPETVPFHELATAAYCPRKLHYARREDDVEPPERIERVRRLAFDYPDLLAASDAALVDRPIAVAPATYRERVRAAADRLGAAWSALVDPSEREAFVEGKDCRGYVPKVLAVDGAPVPSIVSAGAPPENGVWEPQTVRAVAAAKALSWREETSVERAFVEYPAHGVVRGLSVGARRTARYRRALRTVRGLDGPPPRLRDRAKCEPCEYRERCGVRTRTLRSLLGFGGDR